MSPWAAAGARGGGGGGATIGSSDRQWLMPSSTAQKQPTVRIEIRTILEAGPLRLARCGGTDGDRTGCCSCCTLVWSKMEYSFWNSLLSIKPSLSSSKIMMALSR